MLDRREQTEKPTPRRIEKARREGRFAVSRDLVSAIQFFAVVILLGALGGEWFAQLRATTRVGLEQAFRGRLAPGDVLVLTSQMLCRTFLPLALAGAVVLGVTLAAQLGSTRMGLATKRLAPNFNRLNPFARLRELPRQNLAALRQALLLLPLSALAVYIAVHNHLENLLMLPLQGVAGGARQVANLLQDLLWQAAAVLLILGLLDYWRQRRQYLRDLSMTKQEVREEARETEGNPQIRARLRRLRRTLLDRQLLRKVPASIQRPKGGHLS